MIINLVPVNARHHNHRHGHGGISSGGGSSTTSSEKRMRLFGVNMECASSGEDSKGLSLGSAAHVTVGNSLPSSSSLQQRLRMPYEDPLSSSTSKEGTDGGGVSLLVIPRHRILEVDLLGVEHDEESSDLTGMKFLGA
ncbi:uncharacterized protein HKW66_Vig0239800 [Vigna angularis]|uniref:Uncharacterized protein n=1 Tax=Phaseolus angularis TaxID=3914 RepID=A0A8T0JFC1_PHAAN|nr:uncharacterized protein HKW66_Vig0239800 [Vigna angularis]